MLRIACRQYNLPHKLRIGDGTCLGTLRQETPQRTYYNRQFFCSGLPRLHEIQSMDLLGGYPAQILPFFDGQLWTAPKLVGQVVLSTCDAKHALKEWNPFFVKRATRNSYYQNPGDFEVKLKSYVLLAVRKSLPNNPASGRSPERQLSFALSL